jgi:peptide/nickel transport system permease protein
MEFESYSGLIVFESFFRGQWEVCWAAARHLLLPAVALATIPLSVVARMTRAAMLDVMSADYIRTAHAKGNSSWRVILRHALPNASIPIVNVAGLQMGQLLSGAVLTETVFDWPGLGRLLVDAVLKSDYPIVQGATLLIATVYVLLNLTLDTVYVVLDPRVRLGGGR